MSETEPSATPELEEAPPDPTPPPAGELQRGPAHHASPHAWMVGLLLLLLVAASWRAVLGVPGLDYYQFWSVGRAVVHEGERDIYSPSARAELGRRFQERAEVERRSPRERIVARDRAQLETYSTPILYVLIGALSTGSYERDYRLYQAVSTALALLAGILLCRRLGLDWTATGVAVALLSTPFDPYQAELTVGNVNRLQLALWVAFVWISADSRSARGWLLAGLVLGIWVALKPNTLFAVGLVGLALLAEGRWRVFVWQALGGLLGLTIAVGTSAAVFGSLDCWSEWAAALRQLLSDFDAPVQKGNFSLARLLFEWTGRDVSLGLTLLIGLAVAMGVWLGVGRAPVAEADRVERARRDTWLLGLGCTAPLFFAQVAWLHYYVLCLPLLWLLLRPAAPGEGSRARVQLAALAAALLISLAPFHASESRDGQLAAVCILSGAALLLGLGLREPWSRPRAAELSPLPERETPT